CPSFPVASARGSGYIVAPCSHLDSRSVRMPASKKTAKKAAVKKKVPTTQSVAKTKKVAPKKSADPKKVTKASTKLAKSTPKKKPAGKRSPTTTTVPGASGPIKMRAPYEQKRGEEYMSDEMKAHFRGSLLSWKQELMEEVARTVHHMQDEAANFPDP